MIVPARTADPGEALRILERDGASILSVGGTAPDDATRAVRAVLGARLRAYREPVDIATNPQAGASTFFDARTRTVRAESAVELPVHIDGYMVYGDRYPDAVFLLCARPGASGGDSFVVDGYALLDAIDADPGEQELARFLREQTIEQSTPSGEPSRTATVTVSAAGRVAVRCHAHQRPLEGKLPEPRQRELIERWHAIVGEAAAAAPRFLLEPGDLLCADNYRVFHGREPYTGEGRLMRRIWAWSDRSIGAPEVTMLGVEAVPDITRATA